MMVTLQQYLNDLEKQEEDGRRACEDARKKFGVIPNYEDDPECGDCDCCPVNLAGVCPLIGEKS